MNKSRSPIILTVHRLDKYFKVDAGMFTKRKLLLKAVDDVSFTLHKGETLGLVGESGCGKTTVGRLILGLYQPDHGRIFFRPMEQVVKRVVKLDGEVESLEKERVKKKHEGILETITIRKKIHDLKKKANRIAKKSDITVMGRTLLKQTRKYIQILFQDPWSSLNPRILVKDTITEGLREFKLVTKKKLDSVAYELLDNVGLPQSAAHRYPHEFSGGQRQRIGIARALSMNPSLLICDEPLSALDVSIQAQILNLLVFLQDTFDLSYLFIAHDLGVVQYISDRIAVMYVGRIVELAPTERILNNTFHPYTALLLSSVPVADPGYKKQGIIPEGDIPGGIEPPPGCSFHPRCPYCDTTCKKAKPELVMREGGHFVACHHPLISSGKK